MNFGKVAVLLGGKSAEREVSLKSGTMVLNALRSRGVDAHGFDPKEREVAALAKERYDRVVIAEKFIDGIELTIGILGAEALPIIKLETSRDFYDYEAKYIANDTRYIIPSGLSAKKEREVQSLCVRAFQTLGCQGWGR